MASSSIRTQWQNKEYHQLMQDGKLTVDQAKRAEIYKTALQVFYDEVPAVVIAHSTVIWPTRNPVTDFKLHPTGSVRMKNVWLK
jgi:ABC-type transport system substrate-binding protein